MCDSRGSEGHWVSALLNWMHIQQHRVLGSTDRWLSSRRGSEGHRVSPLLLPTLSIMAALFSQAQVKRHTAFDPSCPNQRIVECIMWNVYTSSIRAQGSAER
jgi:hypothetical protein